MHVSDPALEYQSLGGHHPSRQTTGTNRYQAHLDPRLGKLGEHTGSPSADLGDSTRPGDCQNWAT